VQSGEEETNTNTSIAIATVLSSSSRVLFVWWRIRFPATSLFSITQLINQAIKQSSNQTPLLPPTTPPLTTTHYHHYHSVTPPLTPFRLTFASASHV
jgi:hypothetical protein